jgi:hypothetical protein
MPNAWAIDDPDWQPACGGSRLHRMGPAQIDEQGEIIGTREGNIQVVLDADGNPERENSGKAIYINAESGYFGGGH